MGSIHRRREHDQFMQHHLVIAAEQPFGPKFDGAMTGGPVNGRITYPDARFKVSVINYR